MLQGLKLDPEERVSKQINITPGGVNSELHYTVDQLMLSLNDRNGLILKTMYNFDSPHVEAVKQCQVCSLQA